MKKIFSGILIVILLFGGCQPDQTRTDMAEKETTVKPEKVILLIGDGMGLTQVSSAIYFKESPSNFLRFPHTGLMNTSSTSHKITDSAAGATAFSTGKRTYNGAIAVDEDTTKLETIIEQLSKKDYHTGVISTSSITHATPAAFYAHTKSRGLQEEIAAQLTSSEVDIFIGGGTRYFEERSDGKNYIDILSQQGFEFSRTIGELNIDDPDKKYGVLSAPDGLTPAHEERGDFLIQATEKAIEYLSANDRKFFLMAEGSQIDWGGHANNTDYVIAEMIDFDETIGKALDFAVKDGKTLVVVTADHETGGMALASKPLDEGGSDYNEIYPQYATGGHTATLVPVFAYGPGSENFSGIYDNTEIYHKIMALLDSRD